MATTYFTEDHEWIRVEGGVATVGINLRGFIGLPQLRSECRARSIAPDSPALAGQSRSRRVT